jgi:hypothetical protein
LFPASLLDAKKGDWLGWPKPVGESVKRPMGHIRHHDPEVDGGGKLMFWYEVDDASAAPKPAAPVPSVEDDATALAKAIAKLTRPPTQTEARQFAAKFFGKAIRGKAAYAKVIDNLSGYGLELKSGDSPAQRLLCPRSKGKN